MKTVIDRALSRGHADHGWLQTYHTFSFADYYNPQRVHFGALRVLNDDTVAPLEGFGRHPHNNMEVISIPLKGSMRHGDSLEHSEVISPGMIQLMSTGTGIYHSEYNESDTEPLEFLQIWVIPDKQNTKPKYENHDIRPLVKQNEISTFICPDSAIDILQEAWFSMANLDKGIIREYKLHGHHTGVYIFVIEGSVKVGDAILGRRDGMGIWSTTCFEIEALEKSQVLLIEVAM